MLLGRRFPHERIRGCGGIKLASTHIERPTLPNGDDAVTLSLGIERFRSSSAGFPGAMPNSTTTFCPYPAAASGNSTSGGRDYRRVACAGCDSLSSPYRPAVRPYIPHTRMCLQPLSSSWRKILSFQVRSALPSKITKWTPSAPARSIYAHVRESLPAQLASRLPRRILHSMTTHKNNGSDRNYVTRDSDTIQFDEDSVQSRASQKQHLGSRNPMEIVEVADDLSNVMVNCDIFPFSMITWTAKFIRATRNVTVARRKGSSHEHSTR